LAAIAEEVAVAIASSGRRQKTVDCLRVVDFGHENSANGSLQNPKS
jgi:hypothetical protein